MVCGRCMNTVGVCCVILTLAVITAAQGKHKVCSLTHFGFPKCGITEGEREDPKPTAPETAAAAIINGNCQFTEEENLCGYRPLHCPNVTGWQRFRPGGRFYCFPTRDPPTLCVLESPVLNVSSPSCLTITATVFPPAHLDVVLDTSDHLCSLGNVSFGDGRVVRGTLHLDVPPAIGKVLLRAFLPSTDRYRKNGFYGHALSFQSGSCPLLSWKDFINTEGRVSRGQERSWQGVDQWTFERVGGIVEGKDPSSRLTTPVLPATPPGSRPMCLTFTFSLPVEGNSSLTVEIQGQQERLLWRMDRTSSSEHDLLKERGFQEGRLPIEAKSPFRIQFLAKRSDMFTGSRVALRDVVLSRDIPHTDCSVVPSDEQNRDGEEDDDDDGEGPILTASIGAGIAAVILAAVKCLVIHCRLLKKGCR